MSAAGKGRIAILGAGLIGRALDEAHPAIAPMVDKPRPKQDRWAKAFGNLDGNEDTWKTN